jgi:ankyrin repeat protein/L-ascorbate metabolism protein UlaG (beta-lactamase superfamily)
VGESNTNLGFKKSQKEVSKMEKKIIILILLIVLLFVMFAAADDIHDAVQQGNLTKTQSLIAKNPALLNSKTVTGSTPLHVAVMRGHKKLMEYLIGEGANIDALDKEGRTPLICAIMSRKADLAHTLVKRGADVTIKSKEGASAIVYTLFFGPQDLIEPILDHGQDVNERFIGEVTLMQGAAAMGNTNAMKILYERGADVNAISERGETALYFCVREGKTEIATWLFSHGARARCELEGSGRNLLHLATLHGFTDIVELLVDNGVDLDDRDSFGNTALQYATKYGHKKIADLLKKHGADVTLPESYKSRPPFLERTLEDGEAAILYLGNAGWAVKTSDRLLIFDYIENKRKADDASLLNGHIIPEVLKNHKVYVFVTHGHIDHFIPAIYEWKKSLQNIVYIFGFKPNKTPDYVQVMNPREKKCVDGMIIRTIASTDAGVGFLVEVDGLVIFHSGDHANRTKNLEKPFSDEIDYLAGTGLSPDLAFISVKGCGFRDTEAVKTGVYYALRKLQPKTVFPMHASGDEYFYRSFAEEAAKQNFKLDFVCAENRGDSFILRKQ